MKYLKINSLWKREGFDFEKTRQKPSSKKLIEGEHSLPEFANIRRWHVEEKVDGTNIRILFKQVDGQRLIPSIMGRTDAAQIPCHLLSHLQTIATWKNFDRCFSFHEKDFEAYLFGEGYGHKIQAAGKHYRSDVGFILFDCYVNGWWFSRESVKEVAQKLSIPSCPEIGIMEEKEIVEFVKSKPMSRCSQIPQVMEGVVCRSEPLMLLRDKNPVMFKLKTKDF